MVHVEKSVLMQQHFEQFVRKQSRVELKSVGNFVAKTVMDWKSCVGHSTSCISFRSHIDHEEQHH